MPTAARKVFEDALALPTDSRVELVEQLLASLNLPTQAEIDRLWAVEAERRIAQIARGEVQLVPAEQVFAAVRDKYGR